MAIQGQCIGTSFETIEFDDGTGYYNSTHDCSILSTSPYTNHAWCVEMSGCTWVSGDTTYTPPSIGRNNLTGTKFVSGRGNVRSTESTRGTVYNNGPRMVKGTWVAVGNNRYRWTGTNPPVGAYMLDCQDGDNSFQADCSNWSDTAENQYGETSADGSMTSGLTGGHNIHTVCPDCPGKGTMIAVFADGGYAGGDSVLTPGVAARQCTSDVQCPRGYCKIEPFMDRGVCMTRVPGVRGGGSDYDPYSSGNGTRGGGMNNPITQTNLMARRNEFVYESTGQPYVGLYHVHQDGTRMIGTGQMGINHEIKPDEVIVPARRGRMR